MGWEEEELVEEGSWEEEVEVDWREVTRDSTEARLEEYVRARDMPAACRERAQAAPILY